LEERGDIGFCALMNQSIEWQRLCFLFMGKTVMNQYLNEEVITTREMDASALEFVNRRAHVRVYYPSVCPNKFLPEFILHFRAYKILDISEGGIRFVVPHMSLIKNISMTGAIRFPDDMYVEISGEIVRRMKNEIALQLTKGIPYNRIMSEQLRLRNLETKGLITYSNK
jgi:hypothetical protein